MGRWIKLGLATLLMCTVVAATPTVADAAPDRADGAAATEGAAATTQAVQRTTVRWGPFTVPAEGTTDNLIAKPGGCSWLVGFFTDCVNMNIQKPCENCYITKIIPNLVLAGTNTPVNFDTMGMLHHVVNVNWSRPDVTCRPGLLSGTIGLLGLVEGGNERFFASGNERTVMSLPPGYGYYVGSGDNWGLIVDVMNMMPMARDFEFKYTFEWVSAAERTRPVWLDIDQCEDSEVELPHGQYSDVHYNWNSTLNGRIVAIGGHVHDYGISIAVRNATTGELICTSRAGYAAGSNVTPGGPGTGADALHPANWVTQTETWNPEVSLASYQGHISGMEVCQPFTRIRDPWYRAGDRLEMHTQYNMRESTHEGHEAMGIMIAYVDED